MGHLGLALKGSFANATSKRENPRVFSLKARVPAFTFRNQRDLKLQKEWHNSPQTS
ncbi:hypothetical protein XMM379_001542 [Aliiroseovarius sp. xm-m-379]|nr:hypothetical protein [Aliiroseovarius sp. xm-d-517]NRP24853.1 hypothetical protein [Aliiroseovarius sp. xm-m-379]NRP30512.1 hypothetical protein [Aliiroseovarius sp. xm-m-314]NRP33652.1 hypothetical protein [Aliiroseovarius sp. xm-a-104]NRP40759.1 hypothetical protein [Aliiroseovarius sp. xm-m-339-2]NRP44426.1 hypothetical protein [Aliiroseovarius sp. xm-m-378]NRP50329.1 hypothetical protein [Aliiroseovarius sp. xm-m-354]NRP61765.1 hypothetical protein [Aliiroseovarius sp. xm-a-151]NRP65